MFIGLTNTLNGKMKPILFNLDNVIAIEDYKIYANERTFCVDAPLSVITELIELTRKRDRAKNDIEISKIQEAKEEAYMKCLEILHSTPVETENHDFACNIHQKIMEEMRKINA